MHREDLISVSGKNSLLSVILTSIVVLVAFSCVVTTAPTAAAQPQNVRIAYPTIVNVGESLQVVATWDSSTAPDLEGYHCRWCVTPPSGASFCTIVDVGRATSVTLSGVTATTEGLYTITLTCSEYNATLEVWGNPVACSIYANAPPTIDRLTIAPNPVPARTPTTMNAEFSDPRVTDTFTYRWEWSDNSPPLAGQITPTNPPTTTHRLSATHSYENPGTYSATLIIDDGHGVASAAVVTVTVNPANQPPVAIAGPDQSVHVGTLVTVDASQSNDPDGTVQVYQWTMTSKPSGSTATFSDPADVKPTYTADKLGDYTVGLVVTDNVGLKSQPASVTVHATNQKPIANAGPAQTGVIRGTTVHLDGSGSSDPVNDALTYAWTITSQPSNVQLAGDHAVNPTFIPDKPGDYVVKLVVSDGYVDSDAASITLSVINRPPTANAGPDQKVIVRSTVTLDGRLSSDPDNDPLTYGWLIVAKPQLSTATLTNPTSQLPTFVPDRMGTYTMQLIVNDWYVNSDPSTVTVIVTPTKTTVLQDIRTLKTTVQGLPNSAFYSGTKSPQLSVLTAAELQLQYDKYAGAAYTLHSKFLVRTDGCALRGTPDTLDLVRTCAAQSQLFPQGEYVIQELQWLQAHPPEGWRCSCFPLTLFIMQRQIFARLSWVNPFIKVSGA